MSKPHVLITNAVPGDVLAPLAGLAAITQGPGGGDLIPRDDVLALAPNLDAIINQGELRVDAELLDRARKLKIVANIAIGVDNLDGPLMAARGVWATNVPDAFTDATADATLGLLLCAARHLCRGDAFVRAGEWKTFAPGVWDGIRLKGKTLGIVGYGSIGAAVRRRAEAFGMRVIFHRRTVTGDPAWRPLDALLAESDFVSLHTPLTDQTNKLMNAQRLGRMKPGAFLINMARGPVVDEAALVEALKNGRLAGAALDVFASEPLVHPELITLPNVVLTPHLGGGTHEGRREARTLCAENVAAVLRGQKPLTPINVPWKGN